MNEAKKLLKYFKDKKFKYDSNFMKWKLKNTKEILKQNYGHCYDTSYIANEIIPNSFRVFVIETTRKLTKEDREMLLKKKEPKNLTCWSSNTHCFTVFEYNNKFYWFEYSFKKFMGIHEYDTLNKLLKDFVEKWKNTVARLTYGMLTKIDKTPEGIDINKFTDIGVFSKILLTY